MCVKRLGGFLALLAILWMLGGCTSAPCHRGALEPPSLYELQTSTLPVELEWTYQFPENIWNPPIVQSDGPLYVLTCAALYALEPMSGELLWRYAVVNATGGYDTNVRVVPHDGLVLATSERETMLVALDEHSGEVRWQVSFHQYVKSPSSGRPSLTQMVVDDERVYALVSLVRGTAVLAFAVQDGRFLWQADSTIDTGIPFALYLDRDADFLAVDNGTLWYLEKRTGEILDQKSQGVQTYRPPTVTDNTLYPYDRVIRSVSIKTLTERWRFQGECPPEYDIIFRAPIVGDEVLYAPTTCNRLYKLDATTGQLIWDYEAQTNVLAFVQFAGYGYVLTDDGTVTALNLETGQTLGGMRVTPPHVAWATSDHLVATQDRLFLSYGNKQLFAFQTQ